MGTKATERMALERYEPAVYDALNPFHTAKRLLLGAHCHITCLGEVIVRHKLHETLGVSLLHKHFDMLATERLVRRSDIEKRIVKTRPVASSRRELAPYLWKVRWGRGGKPELAPLEFLAESEPSDHLRVDEAFLGEFAEVLHLHGVENVFGLATLDILRVPVSPEEIRVETTDSERRILTVVPDDRATLDVDQLTETFWTFVPEDFDVNVVMKCDSHCNAHCRAHCNFHCRNHCRAHCHNHCRDHPTNFDLGDRLVDPVEPMKAE
jgi:hypothetical protein